jgi:hypothetical protein
VGSGRLLHVIENSDLRCRHDGLALWAKKQKVDFSRFRPGDIVAFLNTTKTHLCVLVMLPEKESAGFLGSYRSPHGRVPPEAFEFISEALGGGGFDMTKAIRKGLEKLLSKKRTVRPPRTPSERAQRLRDRIKAVGAKREWLCAEVGVHKTTLRRWLNGGIAVPDEALLSRVERLIDKEEAEAKR